jgi:hypothetical protein
VIDRSPRNVTGTAAAARVAPEPFSAIVALANVTGELENRFDRCTRTSDPPYVGVRIARIVASSIDGFVRPEASTRSSAPLPVDASDGLAAQAPIQ